MTDILALVAGGLGVFAVIKGEAVLGVAVILLALVEVLT